MNLKKIIPNYWKSISIIICILYLSFAPASTFKKIPSFSNEDKIIHILMYLGLTAVLIFDYRQRNKNNIPTFAFVLICLIFPILTGGIIELMQGYFFPPRSASWLDWISDIIGVTLGWLGMHMIYLKFGKAK